VTSRKICGAGSMAFAGRAAHEPGPTPWRGTRPAVPFAKRVDVASAACHSLAQARYLKSRSESGARRRCRELPWLDIARILASGPLDGVMSLPPEVLNAEATRLRKRFQKAKEKLRKLAAEAGLLGE
jgi:hypothetical protein